MTLPSTHRPDIDGLRAVAVLAVVLFHGFPDVVNGGFIGVDIFFVISGYLISGILMRERDSNSFSYASFYIRRIRRIFPALILVLAACWLLGWFSLFTDEFEKLGTHVVGGGLFAANFVFWNEAGYFDEASGQKLLLHLWSLGIEEQFYIVWPVILGLIWRPRVIAIGIAAIFALSFVINVYLVGISQPAAYYFPFSRFWELLAGALLAWLQLRHPTALRSHINLQSLTGVALLVAGIICIQATSAFPGYWALLPVAGSALLISAGPQAVINRWLLGNRLMVGVGLISYPLYLWHWPVMAFIRISKNDDLSRPYAFRAIAISVLLAWLTYRFVEKPFRSGAPSRAKAIFLSLAMAVIVLAGFAAIATHGYPDRKAATVASPAVLAELKRYNDIYDLADRCQKWLGLTQPESESVICLTTSPKPEFAILGDSHSFAFQAPALMEQVDFNSVSLGQHGCLPFTDYTPRTPTENSNIKKCRESARNALQFIDRNPGIHTVVLATRGPLYFSGYGFGVEGKSEVRMYDQNEREVDARDAFVRGYSQTIQHLQASGKRTIFMIEWPELGVDPKGCVGARLLSVNRTPRKSDCMNLRTEIEARQAEYRSLVNELKTRNPGLEIYDPLALFCDETNCRGVRNDHVYYIDADHLSLYGSKLVVADFLRWAGSPAKVK